jgi:UDP-N-acetylmuramate dehydrogenase
MNAGAHGVETKDVLIEALAININSGEIRKLSDKDFAFVYRGSALPTEWLFLEAKFAGVPKDCESILNTMAEIKEIRQKTQPIHAKTGGSTFKNPPGHKAWQLIDQCELRGYTHGGAKFSELHCNFLVNFNNAKTQDIEYLMNLAKEKVREKFNIELEAEIKILG